jgi:two-component system, chemotaxis family, chemotaxis protein CheY
MDKLPDYSSKNFLIVDDEPFMLSLIDRMLKQCGATHITKAAEGLSGLKTIKDSFTQADCIISDCNMKPVNGLQFLQAVRTGLNPKIPREQAFLMVTGQGDTDVVRTAMMLDVNGYLVKPVALDKLVQAIERAFRKPIEVKEPDYYRAIKLAKLHTLDLEGSEDSPGSKAPWTIIPKGGLKQNTAALKEKIAAFKATHATRDGEQEVKIKNRRQSSLTDVVEGAILAEDILDDGQTLLRRGTYLTHDMIERLRELAVESQTRDYIWIGELAT